jgi:acyl CoA:acetate/3-ketoacid CoA transferase alpha subunit
MRPEYADLIARRPEVPVVERPDKVLSLAEAIRSFIARGQTIYVGAAHGRPNALVRELVRQWWGKQPDWTLALTGFGSPWTALAVGGLVRRLITTFVGEGYPFPVPQALVGPELLAGRISVQNWSMLTLPLRVLAGAMGVPFLPTRSEELRLIRMLDPRRYFLGPA